ncbi:MAG: Porphobilinogen deaminase [Thermoleophilia bacterium]|nr:Porphobilinogen deaminase [Thermoleophilia bacterium]
MKSTKTIRLGTRRSPLALHQAHLAMSAIEAVDPAVAVELVELVSDGDTDERQLTAIAERGIFAARLERALRDGEIDAAVHSSKDIPLAPSADLVLAAWLPRADARDALVGVSAGGVGALPVGATIATGSARRIAALRTLRSDLVAAPIRGNVRTRIERSIARGDAACLLALAGLQRLGIADERTDIVPLPVDQFVPEAGQGAIVIQARAYVDEATGFAWGAVDDLATRRVVSLERELSLLLDGGCTRPVGVHVQLADQRVHAFVSESIDLAGVRMSIDIVDLALAPLLSVSDAIDIDDAAHWCAARVLPLIERALTSHGVASVEAAP